MFDAWTLHLDSNGNVLWQKAYGGAFNDQASSVTVTHDGAFVMGGVTGCQGPGCLDAWFAKVNLNGEVLWQTSYGSLMMDGVFSVKETTDRGFIAAGHTKSFGVPGEESSGDAWVLKLDSQGNIHGNCHNRGPSTTVENNTTARVQDTTATYYETPTTMTITSTTITPSSATIEAQCLSGSRRVSATG